MIRLLLLFLGIIISSYSISFIILYLNLLNNEYTFLQYVLFIIKRSEVLFLLFGLTIIIMAIDGNNILKKIGIKK